jgi:PhoH-like ATPase
MHDPTSLFRFEEHDIYLPMITLEELDNNKKGMTEVARNARQASRFLDEIVSSQESDIENGVPLKDFGTKQASGRLMLQTRAVGMEFPSALPDSGKADNQILAVALDLQHHNTKRSVVLVSKDINMRIKARAIGVPAEDYFNDKVLEDTDLLYTGMRELPKDFWDKHGKDIESWQEHGRTLYRVKGPLVSTLSVNEFVYQDEDKPFYAIVAAQEGKTAVLKTLKDYTHQKNNIWGITARNREQNFALNVLMDPEVDFVTLLGQAGTGKTLLTLASALMQTLEHKVYSEIIITRITVPVGEDIGFLPGTEEEKMNPWMGALEDNLDVLNSTDEEAGDWGRAATRDLIRSRIKVKSLNFMRGRTFLNKFLIIDAQTDENPHHPRRPRHQGGVPGQHRADRYALSHRGFLGFDLCGRSFQGLGTFGPYHLATRRTLAPGRSRGGDSVSMSMAMRALVVCMLLASPLNARAAANTPAPGMGTKQIPVEAFDSPAQVAIKRLKTPDAPARPAQLAAAEIAHPDLITRLEEIRVYGRNEPEDFVGPKKSPLMQFRARMEKDVPLSPAKKTQLALCFIGLCSMYGPEGIPLGDSPEVRADARLYQSTIQLNAQFRGTLQ